MRQRTKMNIMKQDEEFTKKSPSRRASRRACFPIENPALKKRIYQQGLLMYLKDNQQAWLLQGDGTWLRAQPALGEEPHNAQRILLELIK